MAFPTVAGRQSSQSTTDLTSHTVNFDTTPQDGDLLIIAIVFDGVPVITNPSGWSNIAAGTSGGAISARALYKVASGEGSSCTFTTGVGEEMEARFWRIAKGTYSGLPSGGAATGSSTSPNPPSQSPAWGSDDNLWLAWCGTDGAQSPSGYPTNYGQIGGQNSGGATGVGMGYGERELATGTEDPSAFTIGSDEWVALTIAVRGIALLSPAAHSLVATFPGATPQQFQSLTALTLAVSFPAPTLRLLISPSALALSITLPSAAVTGTQMVAPATLAMVASFPTPTINERLRPAAMSLAVVFPAVTIHSPLMPATLQLAATFPSASLVLGPPPPEPPSRVGRQFAIRVYDGDSLAPVDSVVGVGAAEISFDENGPSAAQVQLPSTSAYLAAAFLSPGGIATFWEIDARDAGVPMVWTGRAPTVAQWSPSSPDTTLDLTAMRDELASEPMQVTRVTGGVGAYIAREFIEGRYGGLPIRTGWMAAGRGAEIPVGAETALDLLDSVAADRGETWELVPVPGRVEALLNWYLTPDRRDLTDRVVLVQGLNCEPDSAAIGRPGVAELVGQAQSYLAGTGATTVLVSAPAGPVLGLRAALDAEVSVATASGFAGDKPLEVRPDIPGRAALALASEAALRRRLPQRALCSVEITDPELWYLRPGDLVLTRWPGEPSGYFRDGVALIRTTSYSLTAPVGMTASVELWERRR